MKPQALIIGNEDYNSVESVKASNEEIFISGYTIPFRSSGFIACLKDSEIEWCKRIPSDQPWSSNSITSIIVEKDKIYACGEHVALKLNTEGKLQWIKPFKEGLFRKLLKLNDKLVLVDELGHILLMSTEGEVLKAIRLDVVEVTGKRKFAYLVDACLLGNYIIIAGENHSLFEEEKWSMTAFCFNSELELKWARATPIIEFIPRCSSEETRIFVREIGNVCSDGSRAYVASRFYLSGEGDYMVVTAVTPKGEVDWSIALGESPSASFAGHVVKARGNKLYVFGRVHEYKREKFLGVVVLDKRIGKPQEYYMFENLKGMCVHDVDFVGDYALVAGESMAFCFGDEDDGFLLYWPLGFTGVFEWCGVDWPSVRVRETYFNHMHLPLKLRDIDAKVAEVKVAKSSIEYKLENWKPKIVKATVSRAC